MRRPRNSASMVASGLEVSMRAAISECGLKVATPIAWPPGARMTTSEPAGRALVSASIRISLEKAQGWPERTRRSSPALSSTLGSLSAKLVSFGDAVAPRIGAPSPAIPLAADGRQATFMPADLYFMAQRAQAPCLGGQIALFLQFRGTVRIDNPG